jgi:hypothetical protein
MLLLLLLVSVCQLVAVALGKKRSSAPPSTPTAVNCTSAVTQLTYGRVLWLDERVQAAEALFAGRPCIAVRPLLGGAWLTARRAKLRAAGTDADDGGDTAERELLQWMVLQRDALLAAHPATVPRVWGGCWASLSAAVTVVELTQRWADVVADTRIGAAQRVRIAVNALELVHYLNAFPRVADRDAALADRQDDAHEHDGEPGADLPSSSSSSAHLADFAAGDTVVLGSVVPELFSVSADYFVKLTLLKNVHVYRGRAYGNDVKCKVDHDCRKFFFSQKHVLESLHDDAAPDDFNCNLATSRCSGLDWRTNLYAVCRTLIAPLFGVTADGNVAAPNTKPPALSYPIRNSAANALRDCLSPDPAKRPYPRDLQSELTALTDTELPPFFAPRNDAARAAAVLSSMYNLTELGGMLADIELDAHAVAQNRFKPPTEVTDWAFLFAAGLRDQWLSSPPVSVIGTHAKKPWMSTPIAARDSPHTLRTHAGTTYRLVGAPSCARFERVMLSGALCLKLHDGLPSNWRELFDAEWQRIYATSVDSHFKGAAAADGAPERFSLPVLHDSFQPPPTPKPTVLFRLIPTPAPKLDAGKPAKPKLDASKPAKPKHDDDSKDAQADAEKPTKKPKPAYKDLYAGYKLLGGGSGGSDVDESDDDDVAADDSAAPADEQSSAASMSSTARPPAPKLRPLGWTPDKHSGSIVFVNRPPPIFEKAVTDGPVPPIASIVVDGKLEPPLFTEAPATSAPPFAEAPVLLDLGVARTDVAACVNSSSSFANVMAPFAPLGTQFRITVNLRRKLTGSLMVGASFAAVASVSQCSVVTRFSGEQITVMRPSFATDVGVTATRAIHDAPHKYQLHISCTDKLCTVMLMSFDVSATGQTISTLALAHDVPVRSTQAAGDGLRFLAVQEVDDTGVEPAARVCIDDLRLKQER